jgi:hypothetical protein
MNPGPPPKKRELILEKYDEIVRLRKKDLPWKKIYQKVFLPIEQKKRPALKYFMKVIKSHPPKKENLGARNAEKPRRTTQEKPPQKIQKINIHKNRKKSKRPTFEMEEDI